jgi:hypothetical protein
MAIRAYGAAIIMKRGCIPLIPIAKVTFVA